MIPAFINDIYRRIDMMDDNDPNRERLFSLMQRCTQTKILPKEIKKEKIEEWLQNLLPRVKRTSTRSPKCQLISSVERHDFDQDNISYRWQNVIFLRNFFFVDDRVGGTISKYAITAFQENILERNPDLYRKIINRWSIKEETGEWMLGELAKNIISEGGEAIILSKNFGELETAVRIHAFDPLLFTKYLPASSISFKINLSCCK